MSEQTETPDTAMIQQVATADITWAEYSNEDLGDDKPDTGWYIHIDSDIDDSSFSIGPDHFGPGCKTIDEALRLVEKWAKGRGCEAKAPFIEVAIVRRAP